MVLADCHPSWKGGKQDSWQYRLMLVISDTTGAKNREKIISLLFFWYFFFGRGYGGW